MVERKKKGDKIRWPGDLMTVLRANLITHEMLGITETEQIRLPGVKRAGGKEGREAERKMEVVRRLVLKWLEECDLYELNIGTRENPDWVMRSRWVPDIQRAEYGEWKDGQPDDFFRMITDNFDDFFRNMELFVPRNVGRGNEIDLAKIGETPETQRERRLADPRHLDNKAWFDTHFEKVRADVGREFSDVPYDDRTTPGERIAKAKAPNVTKRRGRPRGAKDVVKRKEKGVDEPKGITAYRNQKREEARARERSAAIADMTGGNAVAVADAPESEEV